MMLTVHFFCALQKKPQKHFLGLFFITYSASTIGTKQQPQIIFTFFVALTV